MTEGAEGIYRKGIGMLVASALFLSTSGIALRNIEVADGWQILFYRSLAFSVTVILFLLLRKDSRIVEDFRRLGWDDVLLVIFLGTGFIAYVFALLHTTVANALFIIGAAPLMLALLGWVVLKERVRKRTWIAIGCATIGLMVMVGGGFSAGRYLGNLIALWVPIAYSVTIILVRRSPQTHMLPALFLAGIFTTLVSALCMSGYEISLRDFMISIYLGIFQVGFGFIFMLLGARYVPAAQVGLVGLAEPICAPIWVWWGMGEVPALTTLVGGVVIFAAIISNGLLNITQSKG